MILKKNYCRHTCTCATQVHMTTAKTKFREVVENMLHKEKFVSHPRGIEMLRVAVQMLRKVQVMPFCIMPLDTCPGSCFRHSFKMCIN